MVDIDYVMELMDWNNSIENQKKGVELARNIKCLNAFLQPGAPYGKSVWENCAKVLTERTNKELVSFLHGMLEWLQDMNWPGAFCILERLKSLKKIPEFQCWYDTCMKCAKALEDEAWINNLEMLKEES